MLIYTRRAAPKEPKRRSRAGKRRIAPPLGIMLIAMVLEDVSHATQKKKCNENRPECDRCIEHGLQCEYEPVKPRKRRRPSVAHSAVSHTPRSPSFPSDLWSNPYDDAEAYDPPSNDDEETVHNWDTSSLFRYAESEASAFDWAVSPGNEEAEEIVRTEPPENVTTSWPLVRSRSQYPDLAMIAPSPVVSPLLEFSAPLYAEFAEQRNRRSLVDHFCNVLSHLIVFKEDTGNPFRQLVLPLSHACSPVMNAIFALSSAHLEYGGIETEEKSLTFHNRALQGLAQLIDKNDQSHREEVLGAIMLLVYYEVLVQRGTSNIVTGHLKGAMTIMKSGPRIRSPTSMFLEHAFRFYDVIAALSLGTCPNTTIQPTAPPFAFTTLHNQNMAGSPLSSVDTLLGFSTELWPIIHRLSHLLSFKKSLEAAQDAGETTKASVLRAEFENTSQAIELALAGWRPSIATGINFPNDDDELPTQEPDVDLSVDPRIQSIINNAEAYRHSAFVYLYRTIHSRPRNHISVQKHAHLSLLACSEVVKYANQCNDGPMSALLWPLFVAACEAITDDDRELALKAFCGTEHRQKMNNIRRAWEVVQEVWRRTDLVDYDVDWRDISAEHGFSIIFG
ncbi:Uncharacterized protein BP5553_03732 [Venustampulla echinocandica]|uniref:Zn(2)-C6 fungal-type domain-containing protein n=1 Tax=Venustampulla echinocandica TaxID=2656787 RepID=A0A370TV28_9HELO|nr:Uncharacterized protein BP5553_03732 [Venustampulla echinocandica]RDL39392.1 Uncharacterized protein BP5553_03732 [Venustampulla echinocandica]